jgi:uncharacterized SAM-binding protein YcdF (DUF218 family)
MHTAYLQPSDADVLIILGYRSKNDQIHPLLLERLETALTLLRSNRINHIIVTGGAVGSSISEAVLMRDYLVSKGIDPDRIKLDIHSKDTIENLQNCQAMMREKGLQTCLIVSNSFHIRRIGIIADSIGLPARFYADRQWYAIARQGIRTINEMRAFIITLRMLKKLN